MMSIGYFDAEARVTKEVAEAVLPYLMKAAGIPEDPSLSSPSMITSSSSSSSSSRATHVPSYSAEKQKAILDMIYTDEGQQQMVKWAVNNERPIKLAVFGGIMVNSVSWNRDSSNVIRNPGAERVQQERVFQALFPCQPGGTFTSYAANTARLGYCIHSNTANFHKIIYSLLIGNGDTITGKNKDGAKAVVSIFPFGDRSIDAKLAIVIFIIDISDTSDQILNALDLVEQAGGLGLITYDRKTIENATKRIAVSNEYIVRPVSASAVGATGDCFQNLFRHLVNIAIQNHSMDSSKYNVGVLPAQLGAYYSRRYPVDIITVGFTMSEAGLVDLQEHKRWNDCLKLIVDERDIATASVANLANVLNIISSQARNSVLGDRSNEEFSYEISTTGATNSVDIQRIQTALNKLDSRGEDKNHKPRFLVSLLDPLPEYAWVTKVIEIIDNLHGTTIIIGIGEEESTAPGHAEILRITTTH